MKRTRAEGLCQHGNVEFSAVDCGNLLLRHARMHDAGQGAGAPTSASHACCGCGQLVYRCGAVVGGDASGSSALRGCACGSILLLDVARSELYCCGCHDYVYLPTFDEGRQLSHVVKRYVDRGLSPGLPHHDPGLEVRAKRARAAKDPALAMLRMEVVATAQRTSKCSVSALGEDLNGQGPEGRSDTSSKAQPTIGTPEVALDGFPAGLRGLNNLGNTCFMNSVLQIFIHSPLMRNYFLGQGHTQASCSRHGKLSGRPCLSCEMDAIFAAAYSGNRAPLSPTDFLYSWWTFADSLAGYQQQDAHEFYLSALSGIASAVITTPVPSSGSINASAFVKQLGVDAGSGHNAAVVKDEDGGAIYPPKAAATMSTKHQPGSASPEGSPSASGAEGSRLVAAALRGGPTSQLGAAMDASIPLVAPGTEGEKGTMAGGEYQFLAAQRSIGRSDGPPDVPAGTANGTADEDDSAAAQEPCGLGPDTGASGSKIGASLNLVDTVFGGVLRSDVTCSVCGHTSTAYDPFLDISLDMVAFGVAPPQHLSMPAAVPPLSGTPPPVSLMAAHQPPASGPEAGHEDADAEADGVSREVVALARPSASACGGRSPQSVSLPSLSRSLSGSGVPTGMTGTALGGEGQGEGEGDEEQQERSHQACPSLSTGSGSGPSRGGHNNRATTVSGRKQLANVASTASEDSCGPQRDYNSMSARDGDGDQIMGEPTAPRAPLLPAQPGDSAVCEGAASPPSTYGPGGAAAALVGPASGGHADGAVGRRAPTPCTADTPGLEAPLPRAEIAAGSGTWVEGSPRMPGRRRYTSRPPGITGNHSPAPEGVIPMITGAHYAAETAAALCGVPSPQGEAIASLRSPHKSRAVDAADAASPDALPDAPGGAAAAAAPAMAGALARTTSDSMAAAESAADGGGLARSPSGRGVGLRTDTTPDECITSPRAPAGYLAAARSATYQLHRKQAQLGPPCLQPGDASPTASHQPSAMDLVAAPDSAVYSGGPGGDPQGRPASRDGGGGGGAVVVEGAQQLQQQLSEPQVSAAATAEPWRDDDVGPGSRGVTPGASGSCIEDTTVTIAADRDEETEVLPPQLPPADEQGACASIGGRRGAGAVGMPKATRGRGRSGGRGRRVGPGGRSLSAGAGASKRGSGVPQMGQASASAGHMMDPRLARRPGAADAAAAPGTSSQAGTAASAGYATLQGCLRHFVTPERLSAAEAWVCSACKRRQPAVKQLSIRRLPPVLALHVKRFEQHHHHHHEMVAGAGHAGGGRPPGLYGAVAVGHAHTHGSSHAALAAPARPGRHAARKIQTQLEFPLSLDLAPYTTPSILRDRYAMRPGQDPARGARAAPSGDALADQVASVQGELRPTPASAPSPGSSAAVPIKPDPEGKVAAASSDGGEPASPDCRYRLFAVISHKGDLSGGHYVVFVRPSGNVDGGWYQCDDAWVTAVSEEDVTACQAYMLFYSSEAC